VNRAAAWGVSVGALLLTASITWLVRDVIGVAAASLLYVPVVLVAAGTGGGRVLAGAMATASAVALNVIIQQPYGTLVVHALEDGITLAVFLVVAMVTTLLVERVREAGALEDALSLKETLLRAVSHELKTPLATLKATAELEAERGSTGAARMLREADRMTRLVQDLLDWSRAGAGAMPVRPALTQAAETLREVAAMATAQVPDRPLEVHDAGTLHGRYDPTLTMRILGLLVGNATRYAPPGTVITLSATADDRHVVFSVQDRGPGIAAAEQDRVFEPFVRRSVVGDGMGLGLAIARTLARAQAGDVTVHPRAGGGAEFRVRVPRLRES
jgi:two-component system sensor histidine kinase KdpD